MYIWNDKTILVAEDVDMNFFYIKEVLESTEINVLHASNGQQAVDMIRENESIDLVLLDIRMPKLNGYQVIEESKTMRPDLAVIVQTAYALVDDREKCMIAGADDYISKPIDPDVLFEKIASFFD